MGAFPTALDSLPLASSANLALARFVQLSGLKKGLFSGSGLLYERAAMYGYGPRGTCSANGSCRLLKSRDTLLAVNLPRPCDWELVPAWLGPWIDDPDIAPQDWSALAHHCQTIAGKDLLTQAHCLGLAVASADVLPPAPPSPARHQRFGPSSKNQSRRRKNPPLVVDLSSLWAGPLCSHLLQQAGCRIIKVESPTRLDGARVGSPEFYRLLNQKKESIMLDFRSEADIRRLQNLIAHADIVIEASRPRALRDAGIHAESLIRSHPGLIWLSITGYGRHGSNAERIGYGDDAAAAAGLARIMYDATGKYQFAGDAIADPLTGISAALYAWQSLQAGGNELISISLLDTVSWCLHQELNTSRTNVLASCQQWLQIGNQLRSLYPAGIRTPTADCATPGQNTAAIFSELALS